MAQKRLRPEEFIKALEKAASETENEILKSDALKFIKILEEIETDCKFLLEVLEDDRDARTLH